MGLKTKILIAEHDSYDLELLHLELQKSDINYISENVATEIEYQNAIENFTPDIILSDYAFPLFNGETAFKIRQERAPNIPFIFVSGTVAEEKQIMFIKNGATDYVIKDKLFTLNTKIKRALKEAEYQQSKYIAEQELLSREKRFIEAQRIAHLGNWELNFETGIGLWSDESCRIYGLLPDENKQS